MSMQEKGRKHGTRRTTFTGADVPGRGGASRSCRLVHILMLRCAYGWDSRPGRLCPIRLDRKGAVREGMNDMECFGCCRRFRSPGRTARSGPSGMWSRSGPAFFLSPQRYWPVRSSRYLAALRQIWGILSVGPLAERSLRLSPNNVWCSSGGILPFRAVRPPFLVGSLFMLTLGGYLLSCCKKRLFFSVLQQ